VQINKEVEHKHKALDSSAHLAE